MMQEQMERMEMEIETLTAILYELRDERRRDYENTAVRDEAIADPAIGGVESRRSLSWGSNPMGYIPIEV